MRMQRPFSQMFAGMILPLAASGSWKVIEYDRVPANTYTHTATSLHIAVDASAGASIYVFEKPEFVHSLRIRGEILSLPKIEDTQLQGDRSHDDFVLRVGVVHMNDKKMNP